MDKLALLIDKNGVFTYLKGRGKYPSIIYLKSNGDSSKMGGGDTEYRIRTEVIYLSIYLSLSGLVLK